MLKTTGLIMESELCDTSGGGLIHPYVIAYMQSGLLPVEIFNWLEGREATEVQSGPSDEPLFGTHIREAIDLLRGR